MTGVGGGEGVMVRGGGALGKLLSVHQTQQVDSEQCSVASTGSQGWVGGVLDQTRRHWALEVSLCGSQFGLRVHRLIESLRLLSNF